jgi:hypothetical protein
MMHFPFYFIRLVLSYSTKVTKMKNPPVVVHMNGGGVECFFLVRRAAAYCSRLM